MKKLLFILCLVLAFNSYSQTRTKKYNSLQKRYEYFENGKMVGYEKYNSLREQWEYYSTESRQSSNNYGEPQSMFNAELASKVLAKRQRDYDNKIKNTKQFLESLGKRYGEFSNHINDINVRNDYLEIMSKKVNIYIDRNMKYIDNPSNFPAISRDFDKMIEQSYKEALNKNTKY